MATPSTLPIVLLSLALLITLYQKNRKYKRWEFYVLMLIPAMTFLVYGYIGIFDPAIEFGRILARYAIISSLTLGLFVAVNIRGK